MGWDGWYGISKVSFNFLYALWAYTSFTNLLVIIIYLYVKILPNFLSLSKFDVKFESGGHAFRK